MSGPLLRSSPADFFRDLLRQACDEQKVSPSESAEFYLVQLLTGFVRPERRLLDRPLALEYLESFDDQTPVRYQKLKQVGDTALFLTGVFTESLEGKAVGPDYYKQLGGLAYRHVASLPGTALGKGVIDLFTEMSVRFVDFVRVLSHMSLDELFASDRDTLRIYRRWLLTRGARDADLLVRRGIVPFAPKKQLLQ
ncbi:MAG: hypothetical protein ACREQ9_09845 [Candidatus Binatia bacterium]